MTSTSTIPGASLPSNRLSKILSGMDPQTFAEHIENAEKAVEQLTPLMALNIESDVRTLIGLCRQDEAEMFGQCREIGWLALQIVESARLAHRSELAEAAKGVWEMVEALSDRGVWHTDALRLHVHALQVLTPGGAISSEGMATIEQELIKMRAAIGATNDCG